MATTRRVSKLALATVAAMGLYIPSFSLPVADSCLQTGAVASAEPSPTCGGDLRECLRLSANMHPTTFGVRYVTAEDVARCMEGFEACIHGTVSGGNPPGGASTGGGSSNPTTGTTSTGSGSPPPGPGRHGPAKSTSSSGGGGGGLPQHFGITFQNLITDCYVDGDSVSCSQKQEPLEGLDDWSGEIKGTLSGRTVTGTQTIRTRFHYTSNGCVETSVGTGPATLVFNSDGTVLMRGGTMNWQTTNCSGGNTQTTPGGEVTATWSAK